jgi:hypothetical protein
LHNPSETNGHNLKKVRCEASRQFSINNKRKYLKEKTNKLAMISQNKNIRDFYRGIEELRRAANLEISY